ncbi:hypothetical protein VQ056_13805 [Paenibacillus sp. JTLBN-2024]
MFTKSSTCCANWAESLPLAGVCAPVPAVPFPAALLPACPFVPSIGS